MNYPEAKAEFIQIWGSLATNWGINKAMAQIHALLLASEHPQTTDEIMAELQISRSNANLNIRALLDWGLIFKKHVPGDRREYFVAEKDIWNVSVKIMRERRKREVDPVVRDIRNVSKFEASGSEEKNFKKLLEEISELADSLMKMGELLERADKLKFLKWVVKGF
jgi:DNA-binding transcriptional regulator GbsR (MarR family)